MKYFIITAILYFLFAPGFIQADYRDSYVIQEKDISIELVQANEDKYSTDLTCKDKTYVPHRGLTYTSYGESCRKYTHGQIGDLYINYQGKSRFIDSILLSTRSTILEDQTYGRIIEPYPQAFKWIKSEEPQINQEQKMIFYSGASSCGHQGEGRILFHSDFYGKNPIPILASCYYLYFDGFLDYKNRPYLLIQEITHNAELKEEQKRTAFWIYDIKKRDMVLRAQGALEREGENQYKYWPEGKTIGKSYLINNKVLILRENPLVLLSRYPRIVSTKRPNTKCRLSLYSGDPNLIIPKARTKFAILNYMSKAQMAVSESNLQYDILYDNHKRCSLNRKDVEVYIPEYPVAVKSDCP